MENKLLCNSYIFIAPILQVWYLWALYMRIIKLKNNSKTYCCIIYIFRISRCPSTNSWWKNVSRYSNAAISKSILRQVADNINSMSLTKFFQTRHVYCFVVHRFIFVLNSSKDHRFSGYNDSIPTFLPRMSYVNLSFKILP